MIQALLTGVVILVTGTMLVSLMVEALRREPKEPTTLSWAPDLPIRHALAAGLRLRYIRTGHGPPLVLLHALRTQLDLFQQVIQELAENFTVYALDLPGCGWSEIPDRDYTPELFTAAVGAFLDEQKITDATLAGISIGGTIPLLLAAQHHASVGRVVAINSYDYAKGRGITRANRLAWLIFTLARIPLVGGTVMRFRTRAILRQILEGGLALPGALPQTLINEMNAVGNRRGHYRAFLSLIRHFTQWEAVRAGYGKIAVPVLLVYGEWDWSQESERRADAVAIPGAVLVVVENGGHLLSLDQPQAIIQLINMFAGNPPEAVSLGP